MVEAGEETRSNIAGKELLSADFSKSPNPWTKV